MAAQRILKPELIEAAGGLRDIAFKLKIGFVRYVMKSFIFHVQGLHLVRDDLRQWLRARFSV